MIKHFEGIKSKIADVRFKPEMDNKVRLGVIQVIDELFLDKVKVLRGVKEEKIEGNDEWN